MKQPVRTLLPWFERDEAVISILGRIPNQDEDTTEFVKTWELSRANLETRPAYRVADIGEQVPSDL